jgi:uncharacterized protein (DUF924 family)
MTPAPVLEYWFSPEVEKDWFVPSAGRDAEIAEKFTPWVEAALAGQLESWTLDARGALALVILLDQFPRHIWRGTAKAFAGDRLAREAADNAIHMAFDWQLDPKARTFLYLPFEHSEDIGHQRKALDLFRERATADAVEWAEKHLRIIERFGRFPHRNSALGRDSTPEEVEFLKQPGSSF